MVSVLVRVDCVITLRLLTEDYTFLMIYSFSPHLFAQAHQESGMYIVLQCTCISGPVMLYYYFSYQACKNGLVQHLEHLLFYGAQIDARTASGNTALHVAALNNEVTMYLYFCWPE